MRKNVGKTKERILAEELIDRLDRMTNSGSYLEVALLTPIGLIYSWQTKKLINLRVIFEAVIEGQRVYENPLGFIALSSVGSGDDYSVIAQVWPLFDRMSEGPTFANDRLLETIKNVWEAFEDQERDSSLVVNRDFRMETGTMIR